MFFLKGESYSQSLPDQTESTHTSQIDRTEGASLLVLNDKFDKQMGKPCAPLSELNQISNIDPTVVLAS